MSIEPVAEAFGRVERAVALLLAGEWDDKEDALRAVFLLNNEIGRLARSEPGKMGEMKELQAHVNAITVSIKTEQGRLAREALEAVRNRLVDLGTKQ